MHVFIRNGKGGVENYVFAAQSRLTDIISLLGLFSFWDWCSFNASASLSATKTSARYWPSKYYVSKDKILRCSFMSILWARINKYRWCFSYLSLAIARLSFCARWAPFPFCLHFYSGITMLRFYCPAKTPGVKHNRVTQISNWKIIHYLIHTWAFCRKSTNWIFISPILCLCVTKTQHKKKYTRLCLLYR